MSGRRRRLRRLATDVAVNLMIASVAVVSVAAVSLGLMGNTPPDDECRRSD